LQELITVAPDKLPNYEAKIKTFYEEHIHTDEEIRFILDGHGRIEHRSCLPWPWY
jgi:1,2-dihydroxy-3-keto-5-methylthiopentene dioxygenase